MSKHLQVGDVVQIKEAYARHRKIDIEHQDALVTYSSQTWWDNYADVRVNGRRFTYHHDRLKLIAREAFASQDWQFIYG